MKLASVIASSIFAAFACVACVASTDPTPGEGTDDPAPNSPDEKTGQTSEAVGTCGTVCTLAGTCSGIERGGKHFSGVFYECCGSYGAAWPTRARPCAFQNGAVDGAVAPGLLTAPLGGNAPLPVELRVVDGGSV